jgi:Protein of unknown function (DUF1838)
MTPTSGSPAAAVAPAVLASVSRGLDLSDPVHNLYAFGKTWGTFGPEPVIGVFHGTMYGWVEGRKLTPLFGYAGTGITLCRLDDGSDGPTLTMRGKETGFFTDLATGEPIDQWDNPFTGERVEVFHFLNDRIGGQLTTVLPVLTVGDHHDEGSRMNDGGGSAATATAPPFVLPWQEYGDEVLLEWDYAHDYPNPVDPARFPRASTGDRINPSEHFTIYTSRAELADVTAPSAHFRAGFSRVSPWWPWMRMGGRRFDTPSGSSGGVMTGRLFSRTARRGHADIPPPLLRAIEERCPDYLEAPADWDLGPILSTWEAYARATPPEA